MPSVPWPLFIYLYRVLRITGIYKEMKRLLIMKWLMQFWSLETQEESMLQFEPQAGESLCLPQAWGVGQEESPCDLGRASLSVLPGPLTA